MPALLLILLVLTIPAMAGEQLIERGDQQLTVDLHFTIVGENKQKETLAWVEHVANALATVYGRWPRDSWRVEVRPIAIFSADPVPWAQVTRGDPDRVSLYIDGMASRDKLVNNWTAYHEFAHLLIPYRGWGDMWFSEGLASYYQNILQFRAGVFDEREMWQRLHDGFIRGRDNRRPDLSLAELSPRMRKERSFMRVYWSGAWYFLKADVELRKRSSGEMTLDDALGQLNQCCRDESMSVESMVRRLDQLTDEQLFVPLYHQLRASHEIPEFESLYRALGLEIEKGRVQLPAAATGFAAQAASAGRRK